MRPTRKAIALICGMMAAVAATALAREPQAPASSAGDTIVLEDFVTLDWIEKSQVSALREGVIKKMELQIGMPVQAGGVIGSLHDEMANLTVTKSQLTAKMVAPRERALASRNLAMSIVATNELLNRKAPGSVSREEMRKAEAEVKVAEAMLLEATEKTKIDEAELALAEQALREHTITAPFGGIIIDRMKNPGESVRANEPVVELGNLDRLRAFGYLRLSDAYRVKEGMTVELQPRLSDDRSGTTLPIDQRKFRGKITFVDPSIQAIAETAVRIHAEFDNLDHELRPGLKGVLTIYLNDTPTLATPAANGLPR